MNSPRMKLKFLKIYCSLHTKSIPEKRLEDQILMNYWPFVKFVKIFHDQTYALYGIYYFSSAAVTNRMLEFN